MAPYSRGDTTMADEPTPPLRFVDGTDDVVEGLAIPFGVPDLYATRFTPATDLALDWFPRRPVLYGHGLDADGPGPTPVGWTTEIRALDKGVWVRAQLDRAHEYYDEIRQLISAGALGWSHGTLDYLIEVGPADEAGIREIRRWPVVEFTLTPTPANPAARVLTRRDAEPILQIIGVGEPLLRIVAVRGWLPEGMTPGDLDDGDFAWLSDAYRRGDEPPSVGRKLPYKVHGRVDPDGWRAAWSRVHQMDDADFAGGPSREEVIAKLLRDKPEDITVSDETRSAPLREGRRNSSADQERIQQIHDLAVELAALCATAIPAGDAAAAGEAARSADAGPRVRVTADAPDPAVRTLLRDYAADLARRLVGR
jgi:hypothetical protein